MKLWLWTLNHLQNTSDADGSRLYSSARQGVTFRLADALCWLLASRQQILDLIELEEKSTANAPGGDGLTGTVAFLSDLCHVQAARAAARRAASAPIWSMDTTGILRGRPGAQRLLPRRELEAWEAYAPGMTAFALDVIQPDGSHPEKAGPCAQCGENSAFQQQRNRLDLCLTGSQLAKDRAARALAMVMIPEVPDYPR